MVTVKDAKGVVHDNWCEFSIQACLAEAANAPLKIAFVSEWFGSIETLQNCLQQSSVTQSFRNAVSNFYSYTYDLNADGTAIVDGGHDMFDNGNKFRITVVSDDGQQLNHLVVHGETKKWNNDMIQLSSMKTHPYQIIGIANGRKSSIRNFSIEQFSNYGADNKGYNDASQGTFTYRKNHVDVTVSYFFDRRTNEFWTHEQVVGSGKDEGHRN